MILNIMLKIKQNLIVYNLTKIVGSHYSLKYKKGIGRNMLPNSFFTIYSNYKCIFLKRN